MRSESEFHRVKALVANGLNDYEVAAVTGVPRATVLRWRRRSGPPQSASRGEKREWTVPDRASYCYLLGAYLGDGNITHKPPNGWTLRVACDQHYPMIIEEIMDAMAVTFPGGHPTRRAASWGASDVLSLSHRGIGAAFPQHGPGRKHLRPIVLEHWQRELTQEYPGALIRGLIHSDGCRVENRFKTKLPSGRVAQYQYVRYFFSNLSADIRGIFVEHCGLLGVRVTRSNHRNLSVSHRDSVAILEEKVGPKR
jgi:hypothetical protein